MSFRIVLTMVAVAFATPALSQLDAGMADFDRSVVITKAAMMADPQDALGKADRSLELAKSLPAGRTADISLATAQWLKAEALIGSNAPDRAKPIVENALVTVKRSAPRSKLAGDLMRSRGAIAAIGGHVQEALTDFQAAYRIFSDAGETRSRAIAIQDIGALYLDAGDYERVLRYYAQSAEIFHDDAYLLLSTHNNRAVVLREMKRYPEAVAEYDAALADARKLHSPLLEAQILTNLAAAQVDAGRIDAADRSVVRASRLTGSGEAHGEQPYVFGVAAKVAAAKGDNTLAARLLERAFAGADLTKTQMPFREFHAVAAQVYEALGNEPAALAHLKAYHRLESEAHDLTASTSAQLLAARFDFANQNNKILRLKQGQLSRDIQIERQRTQYRTTILSGLLVAGGIVFAMLLFGYLSIRRSRNQVRAANDTLTFTNTKLEKALAAKTEFLATTSHEIRTPLNGILGMTQVLLADRAIGPDVRSKVEVVHGAGEAMRALVDDILDVAKMETGEITIAHEPTDLTQILADTMRLWSGQAQVKGLTLAMSAEGAPRTILSDAGRLRQIIFNLMSNAIKFTPAGSVRLTVDVEPGDRDQLIVTVSDTGIGIAADQHDLIFESFRQVDGGTDRQFGGTGLGLAICKRLAAAMGATITVDSALGTGATFVLRMTLEIPATPGVDRGNEDAVLASDLASARLLVVEGNLLKQSIFRNLLAPHVASVEGAVDAETAKTRLAVGSVDHVVADAESGCGGLIEVVRDLSACCRDRGVILTVLFTPTDKIPHGQMVGVGASQIVAKPIDASKLIAALASVYAETDLARTSPNVGDRRVAAGNGL